MGSISETVRVYVRRRPDAWQPISSADIAIGSSGVTQIAEDLLSCEYYSHASKARQRFRAHRFFPTDCSQADVFTAAAMDIADSSLRGYAGTVLAYGPTGSGKTYTMRGDDSRDDRGVVPRCVQHILSNKPADAKVWISYVQLYCEVLSDLLADPDSSYSNQLHIKEKADGSGMCIEGASKHLLESEEQAMALLSMGDAQRNTAATNCNETSSRSHAILILSILLPDGEGVGLREGRLLLVDLAGSERASASAGRAYQRAEEAKSINLSLSALGNVMSALAEGRSHVPYRDSKLTRLLQHSLGSNARTSLLVSLQQPAGDGDAQGEVLNALRFAQRALLVQVLAKQAEKVQDFQALYLSALQRMQQMEQQQPPQQQLQARTDPGEEFREQLREKDEQIYALQQQLEQLRLQPPPPSTSSAPTSDAPCPATAPSSSSNSSSNVKDEEKATAIYWQQQLHALKQQHSHSMQQQRADKQQLQAALAEAQQSLQSSRAQLLQALQELRALTERHAEREQEQRGRLAELLQELQAMQGSRDDLAAQVGAMVSRDKVDEMEALFLDTVNRLADRVQSLEQGKGPEQIPRPIARESRSHPSALPSSQSSHSSSNGSLGDRTVRLEPGRIRPSAASRGVGHLLQSNSHHAV